MKKKKIALRIAIGGRMRKIRKLTRLTQREFSSSFTFGRANLSRIEDGEVFPNLPALAVMYKQLKISLPWLILGEGDMYRSEEIVANASSPTDPEMIALIDLSERVPPFKHLILWQYYVYIYTKHDVLNHYLDGWDQTAHDAVHVPVSTTFSTACAGSDYYSFSFNLKANPFQLGKNHEWLPPSVEDGK